MKKIKIIFGPQESGKSFLSRQIMLGYDYPLFINGRNLKTPKDIVFEFHNIKETTDLILIDDLNPKYIVDWVQELSREELRVNRKRQPSVKIKMPKIVINLEATILPNELMCNKIEPIETLTWVHSNGRLIFEANIIS